MIDAENGVRERETENSDRKDKDQRTVMERKEIRGQWQIWRR